MEKQTQHDTKLFRVINDFSPLRLLKGELIGFNYGIACYNPGQTGKNLSLGLRWDEIQDLVRYGIIENYNYESSFDITKEQKDISKKLSAISPELEKCYKGGIFMSKHDDISSYGKHTRFSFRSIGALLARMSGVKEEDVEKIFDGER